jgi:hypothetical protein
MDEIFKPKMACSGEKLKSKNVITKNMNESFHNSEKSRTFVYFYSNAPLRSYTVVGLCHKISVQVCSWIDPDLVNDRSQKVEEIYFYLLVS